MINTKTSKPEDQQKVIFECRNGEWHEGIYIAKEDLFMIGFKDKGDFFFSRQVKKWKPIFNENKSKAV
jgi:hypothetical protein